MATVSYAQKVDLYSIANFGKYEKQNKEYVQSGKTPKVLLYGNSITEGWAKLRPTFFESNNFLGRGIGGQTSAQLLMRFQQDVVALKPKTVIINIGINDIAENTGTYNEQFTFDNIKSMAQLAKANGIRVILSSVLSINKIGWNKELTEVGEKVKSLNALIEQYARKNGWKYIDYYNTELNDGNGGLKAEYAPDLVHPNEKGYEIMEAVVMRNVK